MVRGSASPQRPRPALATPAGPQVWDPSSKWDPIKRSGGTPPKRLCLWEAAEVTLLTMGTLGSGQLCDFPRFMAELALNPSLWFSTPSPSR